MKSDTQILILFAVALIFLIGLGYWSHRQYMLKKSGSTKIERGNAWGAIKFAVAIIIGIIVLGHLIG